MFTGLYINFALSETIQAYIASLALFHYVHRFSPPPFYPKANPVPISFLYNRSPHSIRREVVDVSRAKRNIVSHAAVNPEFWLPPALSASFHSQNGSKNEEAPAGRVPIKLCDLIFFPATFAVRLYTWLSGSGFGCNVQQSRASPPITDT